MFLTFLAALTLTIAPVQPGRPNRQPQLASSTALTALVFGNDDSIWLSRSFNRGVSFEKPVTVAHLPGLMLGRHRGPHVAVSGRTIIISAIAAKPSAGNLLAWRSEDGGESWSPPTAINDAPASAREGLHTIAAGKDGEFAAVWLDLRSKGTTLFGAYSHDRGATWSKNVQLFQSPGGTICQCCHPSVTAVGHHVFAVMFRNVVSGSRDMYAGLWDTNGTVSAPQKVGTGSWPLEVCPMDGGGIASADGRLITAWRREKTVYVAQRGKPEVAIGEGKDVAVAVAGSATYLAWTGNESVQAQRLGTTPAELLSAHGGFPSLTALPNGKVLAAWEQDGAIETQILK